tara:strand:+ start:202 stop:924 length:723 start_codon:yes stop_codon:yes gene_type:complete
MSAQTYTPTHCPETGRKLTRAERRAANKAKFAQEQAAKRKSAKPKTGKQLFEELGITSEPSPEQLKRKRKAKTKAKAKAKTAKQSRADVLCKQYGLTMEQMFDIMDACQTANTYTPVDVQEDTTPPAPKRTKAKRTTKRKTKNDKLEAQAQRLSNRASAKRNVRKTDVVCDNKPTKASPFGTRTEVDAPAPKARPQHAADYTPPTPISVLREQGYTDVMDMLRAVNMDMMDGGVTADDIL